MSRETALLVLLLGAGLVAKNRLIAVSSAAVLALRLAGAVSVLGFVEVRGVEIGLAFLTIAVLAPIASDRVAVRDVGHLLFSPVGVAALVGGVAASWMNARGVSYLTAQPTTIVAMVLGSMAGALFLRGIPVGPLAAAGITWMLLSAWEMLRR